MTRNATGEPYFDGPLVGDVIPSWTAHFISAVMNAGHNLAIAFLFVIAESNSATCQPHAIAQGLHEAESVAIMQHAIARLPLASKNENT
jgi:hypothetical protein